MRRAVVLGLVTAVVGGVVASVPATGATHGPSAYRNAAGSYSGPGGVTLGSPTTVRTVSSPTVSDTARPTEDRVTITVKDNAGSVVALAISVTPPGATTATRSVACVSASLPVRSGTVVEVTPVAGLCPDGRSSIPRSGTVQMSWHRYLPVPKSAPRFAAPSQRFAVLIGIRDYGGNTASTYGGTGDVNAVRAALLASGWASANIRMVTDGAATATGIRNAMAWLAAHSTSKSFSLLHYSGHVCIASRGPCASGHTYLWSYDNKFIPESEVVTRMKAVKGYQWLDVSGCEGGAFDAGYHASNRMFTGSSHGNETSYEEPRWGQSVWTGLAWDRGYRSGYADPKGKPNHATIAQLANYGIRETAGYTAHQKPGVQHPVMAGGSTAWTLTAPPGG
jgi:hypothetical protein